MKEIRINNYAETRETSKALSQANWDIWVPYFSGVHQDGLAKKAFQGSFQRGDV